jgi:hypothetical protein
MIVFGRSKVKAKDGAFSREIVAQRGSAGFAAACRGGVARCRTRHREAVALHQI